MDTWRPRRICYWYRKLEYRVYGKRLFLLQENRCTTCGNTITHCRVRSVDVRWIWLL